LGLKESLNQEIITKDTLPMIEPVRDSAHLRKTLELFVEKKKQVLVIDNPQVGQVQKGVSLIHKIEDLYKSEYIIPVHIIDNEFDYKWIQKDEFVFLSKMYAKDTLEETIAEFQPKFHIITDSARLRKTITQNKVLLTDPFTRLKHGADYLDLPDEFFSDEMKYAYEDGYIGYSDYGIDGESYFDKGFPSRTVVLHVFYVDKYQNMRIKHFASDSNETAANPAGKFFEALDKLIEWQDRYQKEVPLTIGLKQLIAYKDLVKYPGAGTVKKLLVMHQMELMGHFKKERLFS
jgi:hypothetical protein